MPRPTDRLVHLDIDDAALESVGRWPWPRATLARAIDEVASAGPKVIGLDLILSEAEEERWEPRGDAIVRVPQDERLADALGRIPQVIVPARFPPDVPPIDAFTAAARDILVDDVELDESGLATRLAARPGIDPTRLAALPAMFVTLRKDAVFERIARELRTAPADEPAIRRRLLPNLPPGEQNALTRLVAAQYRRAASLLDLEQRAAPVRPGTPLMRAIEVDAVPVQPLLRRATMTAFVDYPEARDERIRAVPLLIRSGDRLYPQFGLAMACATLGVSLENLSATDNAVTLSIPGRPPIVIPTRTLGAADLKTIASSTPMGIDIPWFGGTEWERMYNPPDVVGSAQHFSLNVVFDTCDTLDRIEGNNTQTDAALKSLYGAMKDETAIARLNAEPLRPEDSPAHVARAARALDDLKEFYAALTTEPVPPPADDEQALQNRTIVASYSALQRLVDKAGALATQLAAQRRVLREALHGKSIILGWAAGGSIADFVGTPLHRRCPGPVVHGVVFNAILTGELWRAAPRWSTPLATLVAGVLTTLFVVRRTPPLALALTLLLAVTYAVVNGVLIFDWGNTILGAAGPFAAMALVWSGATLSQLIGEQRQRALIRRRFRTYVDPQLVDFVEKHPEQASFAGERREMTVVFTDLVGFTTLTERMGEKTVTLLNELWARVIPPVRRHGYLNKFLGDGVMFFYGAPLPNADHARHACEAVLELAEVMAAFERDVTGPRGLPRIDMRMGMTTGDMIVGDAGAGAAGSDYTVLGDNVNLASRLEGANKAFGTHNLVTARTVELAGDTILFRPIASLYVVGRVQAVDVYEAVCRRADVTAAQRERVLLTESLVRAYRSGEFAECLVAADALAAHTPTDGLPTLYRELATGWLRARDRSTFDSAIRLKAK